jgi:hypothetical protein
MVVAPVRGRRVGVDGEGGIVATPELVVGFDESPEARSVLAWAGAEAAREGLSLRRSTS